MAKPIVFDENWVGVVRRSPTNWDRNRMEAWEMILAGGAGFDHLDWSFTPQDETGSGKAPIGDGRLPAGLAALADGIIGARGTLVGSRPIDYDDDEIRHGPGEYRRCNDGGQEQSPGRRAE